MVQEERQNNFVLEVRDLHVHFHTGEGVAEAVRGVSFSLSEGETLGIVGESGCGKSVTAQSILRLVHQPGRIVRGSIHFEGTDLLTVSESEMQRIRGNKISMVFQEPMTALNPVIRIGEQIAEVVRLHRGLNPREADEYSEQMLRRVGISDPAARMKAYPHELSGGMRQRVLIAAALSCNPRIIVADEPTTALDVTTQAQVLDLMRKLQSEFGVSIILITHDLGVVAETTQRVAVMYAGQVVEFATTRELFQAPMHPYTIGLLGSVPRVDDEPVAGRMLPAIRGIVPSLVNLPANACAFRSRCPQAHDRCHVGAPEMTVQGPTHQVRCWLHD